eukprot:SAG31_NODE_3528_length_4153_cov_1.648249_1_plen_70_part_10
MGVASEFDLVPPRGAEQRAARAALAEQARAAQSGRDIFEVLFEMFSRETLSSMQMGKFEASAKLKLRWQL